MGFDFFALGTKLSVGLIQSWMIFEVTLKLRQYYKTNQLDGDRIKSFNKWVNIGRYSTIIFAVVLDFCNLIVLIW